MLCSCVLRVLVCVRAFLVSHCAALCACLLLPSHAVTPSWHSPGAHAKPAMCVHAFRSVVRAVEACCNPQR